MEVAVVDATAHHVVALKPAGLPCELPRDAAADSLVRRLQSADPGRLRLVHRLDAMACGLVLLARTRDAAAHYSAEIAARRWLKIYVARVAASGLRAASLVGPHRAFLKTVGTRATVVRAGGKPSFLEVLATAPAPDDDRCSHLLIRLQTGRFHQIRVMLAHAGAPLVGDRLYGGPEGRVSLEHALLGAFEPEMGPWRVWAAPPHADRDRWAEGMTLAVAAEAITARTTPPPRVPGP